MPRRRDVPVRDIIPDPKYQDRLVGKFINILMKNGKKSVAESIVYGAFGEIEEKTKSDPVKIFRQAIENAKPSLEVKSRRVGGANYQVPIEVRPERRVSLAMRWVTEFARARSGRSMREKLAAELLDAANRRGETIKKKEAVHRMAEANKAFAHYRW